MKNIYRRTLAAVAVSAVCAVGVGTGPGAQADTGPFVNPVTRTTSTYSVVPANDTWPQARDEAAATPAPAGCTNHLAVVTSQAEQDYLDSTQGSLAGDWLGAHRFKPRGPFVWVTGEAFTYTNWFPGEPNNARPGQPYVWVSDEGNKWDDMFANHAGSYVMETECAPFVNPDTGTSSTYTVVASNLAWKKARDAAAATPAPAGCANHLAVVTSQAEQGYLDSTLGSLAGDWLGAQRVKPGGEFVWVTGEPFTYTNWLAGEPNNARPGQPYVWVSDNANQWDDMFANHKGGYLLETECA